MSVYQEQQQHVCVSAVLYQLCVVSGLVWAFVCTRIYEDLRFCVFVIVCIRGVY